MIDLDHRDRSGRRCAKRASQRARRAVRAGLRCSARRTLTDGVVKKPGDIQSRLPTAIDNKQLPTCRRWQSPIFLSRGFVFGCGGPSLTCGFRLGDGGGGFVWCLPGSRVRTPHLRSGLGFDRSHVNVAAARWAGNHGALVASRYIHGEPNLIWTSQQHAAPLQQTGVVSLALPRHRPQPALLRRESRSP